MIGEWPYCPHGQAHSAIQTNEAFIGGLTIENLGDQPVTVYSREELARAMRAANVEQHIHYVPGDRFLTNWAAGIDAQTLDNARVLLTRGSRLPENISDLLPSYRAEMRLLDHKDAIIAICPLP